MLVLVVNDKAYGASCRLSFEDAAEQFYPVGLLAGRRELALSRSASVQLLLDECRVNVNAGRHAVHDTAYRHTVAFAKSGQCEDVPCCVAHESFLSVILRSILLGIRLLRIRLGLRDSVHRSSGGRQSAA